MAMQNSPARSSIDVGSVIADTYTIEAVIGRGGMGAVFLASHKRLPGKKVAIKVLHAELSGEEVLARFKREAEIASRLGHPNIVAVHDFNVMPDGMPYLVLEYLHGESLAQRLRGGPLAVDAALSIVRQVGSALAAAHREGIVHRDLKPQNIFLVPTEVDGRIVEIAKVLDFGISKIRGSQTVKTQDSALLGTPQYMAPEQATGQHENVDERTDVFAFGAIVYEMLSGQPAFSGETIPEVVFKVVYEQPVPLAQHVAGLPDSITLAVHRALAKNAAERFATVGEFVEALTGQPLAPARAGLSIPPPDIGFAAGSRAPNTGKEAFAQTMGSGDHGQAKGLGTDATVSAGPGVAQVPTPPPATQVPTPPPAKRKTGLILASVIGGAAIAAVATYLLTQKPADKPQVAQAAPLADAAVAVVAPDATVAMTVPDAGTPEPVVAEATPPTATPPTATPPTATPPAEPAKQTRPAPKPERKPPPPAEDDDEPEDASDDPNAAKLREAQQALEASQWDRAEQLANAVSTSEDATPRQKIRAALIYGTVQCLARNDEGRARVALRRLAAAPKLRRRLIQVCQRASYLQNER